MKNLMKFAIVLFSVALLSSITFAQEAQTVKNVKNQNANWVDANGDGICDNFGTDLQGSKNQNRKANKGVNKGSGKGFGNGNANGDGTGIRPQDGTGFGKKNGNGICSGDGTGNIHSGRKGNGRRGSK